MKNQNQNENRAEPRAAGRQASAISDASAAPATQREGREIDPRWTWHARTLLALRERLLRESRDLAQQAAEETPNFSMSMADAGTDEADRDLLLAESSRDQDLLYEIEEALRRIQGHTYGICQMTGKPISDDRLEAVPWTRFSKEAEVALEKSGSVRRARLGDLGSVQGPQGRSLEDSETSDEPAPAKEPKDEALGRIFSPSGQHLSFPEPGAGVARKKTQSKPQSRRPKASAG